MTFSNAKISSIERTEEDWSKDRLSSWQQMMFQPNPAKMTRFEFHNSHTLCQSPGFHYNYAQNLSDIFETLIKTFCGMMPFPLNGVMRLKCIFFFSRLAILDKLLLFRCYGRFQTNVRGAFCHVLKRNVYVSQYIFILLHCS